MTDGDQRHAAVIGAGLGGLTAAYRLQQAGWKVSVFEASDHPGGRVQTVSRDGYLIDTGATAIAESYTAYIALAKELGLGDAIVPTTPCVAIYRGGRLHELNLDRRLSLAGTKLLSWRAKLRLLWLLRDIAVAKLRGQLDYADMGRAAPLDTESAGTYAKRLLGQEAADYFASPIVRVMLIADPDKISKVELLSGVANIMATRISTLRGGLGRLPHLLAERVKPFYQHRVEQVIENGAGVKVTYRDASGTRQVEDFDASIVCSQLPDAVSICPGQHALLNPLNQGLGYTQCITVAMAFNQAPRTRAFLVAMPTCEDAGTALMFIEHNKSSDRVPPGRGLIDCHVETDAAASMMDLSDNEIVSRMLQSVQRVFPQLQGQLAFSHVTRWPRALPLTNVGAYRLISNFNTALDPNARIQFASDYMSEAGQNSVIELGNRAAQRLTEQSHNRSSVGNFEPELTKLR